MEGHSLALAKKAALMLSEEAVNVIFVENRPTGEKIFSGGLLGKSGKLLIVLNSEGTKASVEWKGGDERRHTECRIFHVG